MPEKFKDNISIPIAIPAWGLLCLLASAIFTAGIMFQKMDTLIDSQKKNDEKISVIQIKQIEGTATITNLQTQLQNHEMRMAAIERSIFTQGDKK